MANKPQSYKISAKALKEATSKKGKLDYDKYVRHMRDHQDAVIQCFFDAFLVTRDIPTKELGEWLTHQRLIMETLPNQSICFYFQDRRKYGEP